MSIPVCSAQPRSPDQWQGKGRCARDCSAECEYANMLWSAREYYASANHAYTGNRGCSAVHDVNMAVGTCPAANNFIITAIDRERVVPGLNADVQVDVHQVFDVSKSISRGDFGRREDAANHEALIRSPR
jgi:hypothetical protein